MFHSERLVQGKKPITACALPFGGAAAGFKSVEVIQAPIVQWGV